MADEGGSAGCASSLAAARSLRLLFRRPPARPRSPQPYAPTMTEGGIKALLANHNLAPADRPAGSLEAARDQASALPSAFHGIDILISAAPPPGLGMLSPSFPGLGSPLAAPAPPLADVVKAARPRYLFWADGDGFWEREPFGWAGPTGKDERWTRAVKLGSLGKVPQGGKAARVSARRAAPAAVHTLTDRAVVLRNKSPGTDSRVGAPHAPSERHAQPARDERRAEARGRGRRRPRRPRRRSQEGPHRRCR